MNFSGQCHCGAIRFKGFAHPEKVIACHCTDCQVFSGAPFRAVLLVPAEHMEVSGSPKIYVKVAASGNHRAQAFCGECGTQLYATEPNEPKVFNVRLGCVNERAELSPQVQIWRASAMPWLCELAALPSHQQGLGSPLSESAESLPRPT